MRWLWRKRPPPVQVSDDAEEAAQARQHAEASLRAARQKSGEIRRVAAQSHNHLRINHFAQLIDETFRGNR